MITKFGSLFAGHVDFEDMGFDATPVNERRLSDERLAGVFDKAEAIILKMEELNYDTFWAAEHHFRYEGYECIPRLEQINAGSVIGTPQAVILEQLERFGKEVMPHFKKLVS